jgi:hypothetical protein
VIFNLPGYRVVDAVDLTFGGRRIKYNLSILTAPAPTAG